MTKVHAALSRRPRAARPKTEFHCATGSLGRYGRSRSETAGCDVLDSRQEEIGADPLVALIVATAEGDKEAFAQLYRETSGKLMAVALRMAGRRDLAEDILQDSYVAIWRKAEQFDPARGRSFTWLAALVRYRAIDRLRSDLRACRVSVRRDDDGAGPRRVDVAKAVAVRACLEQRQKDHRKAITLAYCYGFTHEELAIRLEAPLGTVKSWVRDGLVQLGNSLEQ